MTGVLHTEQCLIGISQFPERRRISQTKHVAVEIKAPTLKPEQSRNQKTAERTIRGLAWIPRSPIEPSLLQLMLLKQGDRDRQTASSPQRVS
jgi:hypothetical protein